MLENLEGESLIEVFGSMDVAGRRDVTLSWASTKVGMKAWSQEMLSRSGHAKDESLKPFPKQFKTAWRCAKAFTAGEIDKGDLVLLWACREKFDPTKQVNAEDGSAPFDRHGLVFIDIDLKSRNAALTVMEQIRERLEHPYPLSLSPSGDGVKLIVPAGVGKGVPWNTKSRALFCQAVLEALVGDLAQTITLDITKAATSRAYLSEDILHGLIGEDGREVVPVLIEASRSLDSIYGEKRVAGEFPTITKWKLAPISVATFQHLVQAQIGALGYGRRLSPKDSIPALSAALSTFIQDNNPQIISGELPELLLQEDHIASLTEIQRAQIEKSGASLFLRQLQGPLAVLRFVISSRRWGVDAPRSTRFISHGLAQCGIEIHPSQVDNLLKRLVDLGLLERTKPAQRGRTPSWYRLLGPAEQDFNRAMEGQPIVLGAPKDGEWNKTLIRRVWLFNNPNVWLEHVTSLPGIYAKTDRIRKCVMIWNWSAQKRGLEPIDSLNLAGITS